MLALEKALVQSIVDVHAGKNPARGDLLLDLARLVETFDAHAEDLRDLHGIVHEGITVNSWYPTQD